MTRLYLLIGGLSLIITLAGALWWSIDRNATDRARTDGLQSTIETRERMDNADTGSGNASDDADWLRERGSR
jgi:hypothetical protein